MKLYLDSSAIVKLITREQESTALRRYLRRQKGDGRTTSSLARVEVIRAVVGEGPSAVAHARRVLARIDQITLDRTLLDRAAVLLPNSIVPSLDAIHLASALLVDVELRAVITYDRRMTEAATALGLPTESPV